MRIFLVYLLIKKGKRMENPRRYVLNQVVGQIEIMYHLEECNEKNAEYYYIPATE